MTGHDPWAMLILYSSSVSHFFNFLLSERHTLSFSSAGRFQQTVQAYTQSIQCVIGYPDLAYHKRVPNRKEVDRFAMSSMASTIYLTTVKLCTKCSLHLYHPYISACLDPQVQFFFTVNGLLCDIFEGEQVIQSTQTQADVLKQLALFKVIYILS